MAKVAGHTSLRRFCALLLVAGVAACDSRRVSPRVEPPLPAGIAAIRAHEPPDGDLSDLEPVARAVGSARVVLLGEAAHGDGAAVAAKARLLRYLHRRLGFDVFAWEAGVYDCARMDEALRAGAPLDEAMATGLFESAAKSEEIRRLFAYARAERDAGRPIEMAGIDPQFSGRARGADYPQWILGFFDAASPAIVDDATRKGIDRAFGRFPKLAHFQPLTPGERAEDRAVFEGLARLLARERPALEAKHGADAVALAERTIAGVIALYGWHEAVHADASTHMAWSDQPELNDVRDAAMAENLLWLARVRRPASKIAVSLASFHAMRAPDALAAPRFGAFVSTGQAVARALGSDVYVIAFTSYAGASGLDRPHPFDTARSGSLEARWHDLGRTALFVELGRAGEARAPAYFLGHTSFEGRWDAVFDAAVFLDRMEAVRQIPR